MQEEQIFSDDEEYDDPDQGTPEDGDTRKYLLFCSRDLLFGVEASYVVEIITNHTITALPLVPRYVRGIINLRGQIIPIVDIRMLLGQEDAAGDCIVILNIDGTMVGILVDTVQKMIDVAKDTILPSPAKDRQELVSGMCSLPEGQTMLVFDCAQLLHQG